MGNVIDDITRGVGGAVGGTEMKHIDHSSDSPLNIIQSSSLVVVENKNLDVDLNKTEVEVKQQIKQLMENLSDNDVDILFKKFTLAISTETSKFSFWIEGTNETNAKMHYGFFESLSKNKILTIKTTLFKASVNFETKRHILIEHKEEAAFGGTKWHNNTDYYNNRGITPQEIDTLFSFLKNTLTSNTTFQSLQNQSFVSLK